MNVLDNIIVTDIEKPMIVHSAKGRYQNMTNRQTFGISLCLSGQITYSMNGKDYVSDPSCAILLPQGGNYSIVGDKEGLFPLVNFKSENLNCNEFVILPLDNPQRCLKKFDTLKNLSFRNAERLEIMGTFYQLLAAVSYENTSKNNPLTSVMKFIEDNLSDPELSNIKLAQEISVSEVYLRKLFVKHLKTTPKQYILDARIRKAQQMLLDTPYSVTAISEKCGFSSLYSFCRSFKNKTDMTPTEYIAENRIFEI